MAARERHVIICRGRALQAPPRTAATLLEASRSALAKWASARGIAHELHPR